MKNTTNDSTTVGNVELIDGHRYRAADGRIHTLTLVSDDLEVASVYLNILNAKAIGLLTFDTPTKEPQIFKTDLPLLGGHPYYLGFRKGLVGIMEKSDGGLGDKWELVEDLSDTRDQPIVGPEVSSVAPTETRFRKCPSCGFVSK